MFFQKSFPGGELLSISLELAQLPYAEVNLVTGLRVGGLKDGLDIGLIKYVGALREHWRYAPFTAL